MLPQSQPSKNVTELEDSDTLVQASRSASSEMLAVSFSFAGLVFCFLVSWVPCTAQADESRRLEAVNYVDSELYYNEPAPATAAVMMPSRGPRLLIEIGINPTRPTSATAAINAGKDRGTSREREARNSEVTVRSVAVTASARSEARTEGRMCRISFRALDMSFIKVWTQR